MGVRLHWLVASLIKILDEAQVERTAAILIALKFGDRGVSGFSVVEADNTRASRSSTRFILNLSLFYLANSGKEFDQIIVAGRPGQLSSQLVSVIIIIQQRGQHSRCERKSSRLSPCQQLHSR